MTAVPVNGLLLDVARETARAVSKVHSEGSSMGLSVHQKSNSGDIVTQVDRHAENVARAHILSRRPHDSITGEEGGAQIGSSNIEWVVDPLDGTTNYALGWPAYCVSIAAIDTETGATLAGVVRSEGLGLEFFATRGGGAIMVDSSAAETRLRPPVEGLPKLLVTGVSYDSDIRAAQYKDLCEFAKPFDDLRAIGSAALALCSVARGAAAAYWETDLYRYDWAAGLLIAQEAGAVAKHTQGDRGGILTYWKNVMQADLELRLPITS